MILKDNNYIALNTKNTSYIIKISDRGDLLQLHYGKSIPFEDVRIIEERRTVLLVNTLYPTSEESYGIDAMSFEYSFANRGDSRSVAGIFNNSLGNAFDFSVKEINLQGKPHFLNKACSYGYDDCLEITLIEPLKGIKISLYYLIYEDCDIITRFVKIYNNSEDIINIKKLMSLQLDIRATNEKKLLTFDGAWCRERMKNERHIIQGKYLAGSYSGLSGAECNPFFMVADERSDNFCGDCYGFNLIYSGSHEISVEKTPYNGIRIMNGISSEGFNYKLYDGEFQTPESVMTFSDAGYNGVSQKMHSFIKNHILRYKKDIPIMINSWEAMYFDINEKKIKEVADKAKDLGFEALIIDDGWFGKRNDDKTSLGDWFENEAKFSNGLASISDYIHSKNLKFGLWFEPEMVSVESELYKKHPDWALINPAVRQIVGRNQYILDLTNDDVLKYVFNSLDNAIEKYKIDYIKWDFNRRFADIGTSESYHFDYINAFYKILDKLTDKYPDLIIEGCASGGGRFDLGMLCYCPIIWTSDNTDPLSRAEIQEGTSYGYPLNVMVNHISSSPNHQTNRSSTIKTRSDIAYYGNLGFQTDITTSLKDKEIIEIIKSYKSFRNRIKDCRFYRLSDTHKCNYSIWQLCDKDGEGLILFFNKRFYTVSTLPIIKLQGLNENQKYIIEGLTKDDIGGVTALGKTLMNYGMNLLQNYQGVNLDNNTNRLLDSSTTIFRIRKETIL